MRNRKAMSEAMWIVVAILVAFIAGLILMTIFSGSANKAGKQSDKAIATTGGGMKNQTCNSLCISCKMQFGDTACDDNANWDLLRGSCPNNQHLCS